MKLSPLETAAASPEVATELLLVRHAEVEARYQGVFGGRIDMDLSPRGREQAVTLAGYLRQKPYDALYASPMKRVQQTVAPLAVNGAPKPIIVPELREVDFGDWTGLGWEEVQAKFQVSAFSWLEQLECGAIANAECGEDLRDRLEPCLAQIRQNHTGQVVVVACHGGVIRVFLALLLGLPLSKMSAFEIDYASVTQVGLFRQKARLRLLNFTPWRHTAS